MMRIVVDIYDGEDTQGTKEAVAMLLEPLGRVRVVNVIVDGKEEKRDGEDTQGTKEAVAMLLEPLGRVRVVNVIVDGKEEKR